MPVTTMDLIRRGARQFAGRTALTFAGGKLTYEEVNRLANRLANEFARRGLSHGKRIGLLLNNSLYSVPVDFACAKAGLARVPLNARLSLDEHAHMLMETGAALLVCGNDLAERGQALAERLDALELALLEGTGGLLEAAREMPDSEPALAHAPDDVLLILYTSGTTGTLKAAQHTQASYAAIAVNILTNLLAPERGDVMLHAASLIHASGTFVLPLWLRGGVSAILPRFEPRAFLEAIADEQATYVNLVPTMLQMLLATPGVEDADLSSVKRIVYGASPMPRPVIERGMALWGPRFVQYYGQTEAPLCMTVLCAEDHVPELFGACGQPAAEAEIRLVDNQGVEVAEGEIGEIAVRAPFTMRGYFNAPELDAATRLPEGWLRTRDLARFDERGYLHLVDRASDMIITGGYNVYPREVEDVLLEHPSVRECAVVGLPDEKWVEAVTAFVVADAPAPGAASLIAFVRERLAAYKVPKAVRFVDSIPKSPVGKVLRRALRESA